MANFNKSFNFRNGVQVDNDNFVVNSNGLVGIGTTIPKEYLLNVYGDTRITGLVTTNNIFTQNLISSGVSTIGFLTAENIQVSGSVTATTFYGSASGLTGIYAIAVNGWYVDGGTISTTSKVGIGTTLPTGSLQIGLGITINDDGNAIYSGIITASNFSGIGSDIIDINASNISLGTLSNDRLPSDINISGIVTASNFSGIGSNITDINASNISLGTLSNDRLPSDINISGIVTGYGFSGFGTDIFGINASNISLGTLSNDRLPSDINISGIITASNFVGNLTGTASTAQSLTGSPNITVTNITASNLNSIGIITATTINVGSGGTSFSALSSGRIGIGTALPTSELQIRKESGSLLEVISNTGQSTISIGQSVGIGKSAATLVFGNEEKTFDIINNDTGNINLVLHGGSSGINTGNFSWKYGQNFDNLMTLTYEGNLGVGKTDPENTLHVVGTSTISNDAYFGNNVYIKSDLFVDGNISGSLSFPETINNTNLNNATGVSTFYRIETEKLGIGTINPLTSGVDFDAQNKTAIFGSIGINTDKAPEQILSVGGGIVCESIGIGTTSPNEDVEIYGNILIYPAQDSFVSSIDMYGSNIHFDGESIVGVGTTAPLGALDFSNAGGSIPGKIASFMIVPRVTDSERVGLVTQIGAIIYNLTLNKFQGYTGVGWTDFN
jgi:hypothetical protein